jgi:hypothetical protein
MNKGYDYQERYRRVPGMDRSNFQNCRMGCQCYGCKFTECFAKCKRKYGCLAPVIKCKKHI